jgi:hypothetical protein
VLEQLGWHKCMAYCVNIGGVSGYGVEEYLRFDGTGYGLNKFHGRSSIAVQNVKCCI